ncbi:hypothetical protein P691DRAFT_763984 [Macrolepiota fuliginosa MF-IS2]|uniref:Uncharacterized protein n=1 Tax=Macrolepiota fuliginosa MF-IS2 TaxID=1400762 RepID=A0A9P5X6L0_9AGAR|nr:hypothetical protein P691DRAFT_763984 [Macrolepiota fuliginosa MF-IS2]
MHHEWCTTWAPYGHTDLLPTLFFEEFAQFLENLYKNGEPITLDDLPTPPDHNIMDIPLDKEISVVFAGALAFGLYFSTFLSCVRWFLFVDEGWKVRRNIRWPTVAMTVLIFGVNVVFLSWTLHWTMVKAWHAISNPGVPYQVPEWADIIWCTLPNCNVLLADIAAVDISPLITDHSACAKTMPLI